MRIAYAHAMPIPAFYANTVHVTQMCEAFGKAGHDVRLMVPNGGTGDPYAHYGVARTFAIDRVWRRVPVPGNGWLFAAAQQHLLSRFRPDLIYTRHLPSALIGTARGYDVIWEAHGPPCSLGRADRAALGRLLRSPKLRRITVISEALRALFVAQLVDIERLPDLLFVAHDGARADQAYRPPRSGNPPLAVYTGSFYAGRGIELLLDIAASMPNLRFRLVGCAPEAMLDWRARTAALDNVELVARCSPAEVAAHLSEADILLAPYQREIGNVLTDLNTADFCSPLKLFEYMAAGRAMIVSDLPVFHEVLDPGVTGQFCKPDDVRQWVGTLNALVADETNRNVMGSNARARFLERYSWNARARAVIDGLI